MGIEVVKEVENVEEEKKVLEQTFNRIELHLRFMWHSESLHEPLPETRRCEDNIEKGNYDASRPSPNDVLLDTQCSHYVFNNSELFHNLHTSPITITVQGQVENASFSTNKVGYFLDLKEEVYYSSQARANLLSFSKVWNQYDILTDSEAREEG